MYVSNILKYYIKNYTKYVSESILLIQRKYAKNLYFIELFNWKYINIHFCTIDWNVIKTHDTFSKTDLRKSCNMILNFDGLETWFLWINDFFKSKEHIKMMIFSTSV